ncbi:MAG: hypothetical protein AAB369_04235, partial [Chloroflexota bacterium]
PADLMAGWVRHVFDLWKADQAKFVHPPLWIPLEQVKNCLVRQQDKALTLVVKEHALLECPAGHTDGYGRVEVCIDGTTKEAKEMISGIDLPVSGRMLVHLAIELAEYTALTEMGVWHAL